MFFILKAGAVVMLASTVLYQPITNEEIKKDKNKNQSISQPTTSFKLKNKPVKKKLKYRSLKTIKNSGANYYPSEEDSSKHKVSGYRGQTFVYGQVRSSKNGKVEGYIYHPKNAKTYVYGERVKDTLNLYDTSGNLYQMFYH